MKTCVGLFDVNAAQLLGAFVGQQPPLQAKQDHCSISNLHNQERTSINLPQTYIQTLL